MPFLYPAGFMLLTDVCDFFKNPWKQVILRQNDVFSCLAWNGNDFSAKFPGDEEETIHRTERRPNAVAGRRLGCGTKVPFPGKVLKAHAVSLGTFPQQLIRPRHLHWIEGALDGKCGEYQRNLCCFYLQGRKCHHYNNKWNLRNAGFPR